MKLDLKSLLKDKNVLYVTLFIAVTNMFAYLMFRQFDAIIFFVIIGIIASYFSKNMIVIMLVALVSTNLAISIKMIGRVKEGLENMKKEDDKKKDNKKKDNKNKDNKNKDNKNKDNKKNEQPSPHILTDKNEPKCVGDACLKKKATGEAFTQQLHPARINAMSDDEDGEDDANPSVNYASTLESAYDNLDKLLSSDAINKMSEDTHRLAEKQQLLMGNIAKLEPMMKKAGSLLEGLDMKGLGNMMDGLQSKLGGVKKE